MRVIFPAPWSCFHSDNRINKPCKNTKTGLSNQTTATAAMQSYRGTHQTPLTTEEADSLRQQSIHCLQICRLQSAIGLAQFQAAYQHVVAGFG